MFQEIESEVLSVGQVLDVLNRDTERLKQQLNRGKVAPAMEAETSEHDGPQICVKTTKLAFKYTYPDLVHNLGLMMKDFYVDQIKFIHLNDADENFWGDYGIHKMTVRKL